MMLRALAAAVLLRAVRDAAGQVTPRSEMISPERTAAIVEEARAFLHDADNPVLAYWCSVLDMEPATVSAGAERAGGILHEQYEQRIARSRWARR